MNDKDEMKQEEIVTGYKATDANMRCREFQFELGVWHKHNGEIAMCKSGFHFCEYPSGPWSFYSSAGTRIFKVHARGVIKGEEPGADLKHVAMEIMLTEEILFTGDRNTGDRNTGDRNTGDMNTGDMNTGHRNTGHGNCIDHCSGHLCMKIQPRVVFDKTVNEGVDIDIYLINELAELMMSDEPIIDFSRFLLIPNATEKKIKNLHAAHIKRRSNDK